MIINVDSLVPHLKEKVRPTQSDTSRHLLCPHCGIRTKLNVLADGRRKCTVCGKKFRVHKVTEENKLQQCAEILLCFCLDLSPHKAAQITNHRHRLVSLFYDHFRRLITEASLSEEEIRLLSSHKGDIQVVHKKSQCRWCLSKIRPGEEAEKPPVFGVKFCDSGEVKIDPLADDEAVMYFHMFGSEKEVSGRQGGYAGFICCGKFHRLVKDEQTNQGTEQLWTWMRERVRTHHGIWKKNTGFYLKELEWKYNNRSLRPELLAKKLIDLIPADFLTTWSLRTK